MEPITKSSNLPRVRSIQFSFDLVTTGFSKDTNENINDFVNNLGHLESTNLNNFYNQLNTMNNEFLNNIPKKDFNLIPNFNFADQFSDIKEGDIIVFELYYDDITEFYRGPMFYITGNSSNKEVTRFYRIGDEPDDAYILPSEALLILVRNGATTSGAIADLYRGVDIEAISVPEELNYRAKDPYTGKTRKLSGIYYLGTITKSSNVFDIDGNIMYLGDKVNLSNYH